MFSCYTCGAVIYDNKDAFVSYTCNHQVCGMCKHFSDKGYCSKCSSAMNMRHNFDAVRTSVMDKYTISIQLDEEKKKNFYLNEGIKNLTLKIERLESDNSQHLSELGRLNHKITELINTCALNTSEVLKYSHLYASKTHYCENIIRRFNRSEDALKRRIIELKETIVNRDNSNLYLRNRIKQIYVDMEKKSC